MRFGDFKQFGYSLISSRWGLSRSAVAALFVALAAPVMAQDEGAEAPPKPVKLMTLSSSPIMIERQFFGQVAAKQTVDLAFQVPGQLEQLEATEGTTKAKGDLIAALDLDGYTRAVAQAEANYDKAKRDYERLQTLQGGVVSEVQVRDAATTLSLAEIALAGAKDDLEHATLRAPFDALIARRVVANYQTVAAGTPVVRLHDISEMRVDVEVPEVLFRQAGKEDDITFTAEFPGDPKAYPLVEREFETETSSVGQTYTITFAFVENPGAFVFPGASVTVSANVEGAVPDGVILPETALVYDAGGAAHVMVFAEDKVSRVPVSIEMRADGRIHMLEGPEDGAQIVMTGALQLRDGQAARAFTKIGE